MIRKLDIPTTVGSIVLLVISACVQSADTIGFELADSAGVVIATNSHAPESVPEWHLTPAVQLTVDENDPADQLSGVYGATRLSDGRIVILNAEANEVRFYSPQGMRLLTTGRRGQGPGEFRQPTGVWRLHGDTIAVWDDRNRRVTHIGPDGAVLRTTALAGGAANPRAIGVGSDGSFVVLDELFDIPDAGFKESQISLTQHAPDGSISRQLGKFPYVRIGIYEGIGLIGAPLFEPRTTASADDSGFWVGTARAYEAMRYESTGRVSRILRWTGPDRKVTSEAIATAHRIRLETTSADGQARTRRMQEVQPVSELFPAYDQIMRSTIGELLVREYVRPGVLENSRWIVFDAAGKLTARIVGPPSLTVLEVGADYLLGTTRDEDDVELVQLYTIVRSSKQQ